MKMLTTVSILSICGKGTKSYKEFYFMIPSCVLSSNIKYLFSEIIMREMKDRPGVKIV